VNRWPSSRPSFAAVAASSHCCRLPVDSETFRIPPLMSQRTIRILDTGGGGVGPLRCDRVAVEQKFNTD